MQYIERFGEGNDLSLAGHRARPRPRGVHRPFIGSNQFQRMPCNAPSFARYGLEAELKSESHSGQKLTES